MTTAETPLTFTTCATTMAIPTRRAAPGEFVPRNFSTTPSGNTIYSTTPGGTRIIYDRSTLLKLSQSPLARTPPSGMAYVEGVTKTSSARNGLMPPPSSGKRASALGGSKSGHASEDEEHHHDEKHKERGVFEMDME